MDKQTHLGLICVIALTAGLHITSAENLTCYECTDDPEGEVDTNHTYDPDCGSYAYHGHTVITAGWKPTCMITIYYNGYVTRDWYGRSGLDEDDCRYEAAFKQCYCQGKNCNTDSYCEQCSYEAQHQVPLK
ncbi:unnamed protein product [Meganyctiphanes norvegica]|uniref:Uncharacterized protein n=1 Tax=Meganyctiphanes norvegica TaxID=48144 RepID=A0AAV2QEF4_MEGNR